MKLVILLSLVCFASAKSIQPAEIPNDNALGNSLRDFVNLIPLDEVLPYLLEALSQDEEIIEVLTFMQGPEFREIVLTVQNMQEYKDTLSKLYNLGLDVYLYLNALHDILGLPEISRPEDLKTNTFQTRTLTGFIQGLKDMLPMDELKAVYEDKMKNDKVFIEAMATIRTPEFIHIGDVVQAMPEWFELLDRLQAKGIDTDVLLQLIKDFFGWN